MRKQINGWAKAKFLHPPIKVGRQDYCWEIDLMDVQNNAIFCPRQNHGIRYLFCCIDQFDKHVWVR